MFFRIAVTMPLAGRLLPRCRAGGRRRLKSSHHDRGWLCSASVEVTTGGS
jgi:hypothetical protein